MMGRGVCGVGEIPRNMKYDEVKVTINSCHSEKE